jgi:hypothetical protein
MPWTLTQTGRLCLLAATPDAYAVCHVHVTLKATIMRSTETREILTLEAGERRFFQARAATLVLAQAGSLTLTRPLSTVAGMLRPSQVRLDSGEAYWIDEAGWVCLEAGKGMADALVVTPAETGLVVTLKNLVRHVHARWLARQRKMHNQAA